MWTLVVEDYGKINYAKIEFSPFTMFIGDNNSGKSYIMTLIYGLFSTRFANFKINTNSECCKSCLEILELKIRDNNGRIAFNEDEFNMLVDLLNEVLELNKEFFLQQLFNKKMSIGKIKVEVPYYSGLSVEYIPDFKDSNTGVFCYIDTKGKKRQYFSGILLEREILANPLPLLRYLLSSILKYVNGKNPPAYLPASRTGFMLTFKKLVASSLNENFVIEKSDTEALLTKPCIDFLSNISTLSQSKKSEKYKEIIRFIDENIIDGTVEYDELPTSDIHYFPAGGSRSESLPLHVSSGVVTELAPLSLYLKYREFDTLMMEEPEMCLHPYLQWQIAKVMIRLMNAGNNILITTHSDTILQHVNNMIKLSNNDNSNALLNKYGYTLEDKLKVSQIKVYQFETKEHKTVISELKCTINGFAAPTFNNTLFDMLSETREFEIEED